MLRYLLTTYVPYDPNAWVQFWNSIMETIRSASTVGLLIFTALMAVNILRRVIRIFFK